MIRIKNNVQIDGIRKSCRIAAEVLNQLSRHITDGVNTAYLNELACNYMTQHKATSAALNYKGFPSSICTSINEVICHGIPSQKDVLKIGDIVGIDVSTILNGYYGDTCKTFSVGQGSLKVKSLLRVAQNALQLGIKEVAPGKHFGDIGHAISQYAYAEGYSVVYEFVGHGVGIEFHEEPAIAHVAARGSGPIMLEGMVFTIEPMLNAGKPQAIIDSKDKWTTRTIDGNLSAQFEHTVLVTKNGCEILTAI